MAGRAASGGEASLQPLKEDERSEGHGSVELGAVEGIGDEMGKFRLRSARRGRVLGAGKEMRDEPTAEASGVFVPVVGVGLGGGSGGRGFRGLVGKVSNQKI